MYEAYHGKQWDEANNATFGHSAVDPSGAMNEYPEIEFNYTDTDTFDNEIAELYSYTECKEFHSNLKAFEDVCKELKIVPLWQSLEDNQRESIIIRLSDRLELCDLAARMKAARAILYIAQGCWSEVQSDQELFVWLKKNIHLLCRFGIWASFVQLLYMEIGVIDPNEVPAKPPVAANLNYSTELRIVLSVLYTMHEVIRFSEGTEDDELFKEIREQHKEELLTPQGEDDDLLVVTLMNMVTRFCNSLAPSYPVKKLVLLVWKIILFSMGGTETLKELRVKYRTEAGLDTSWEDTLEVSRTMRASSPPTSAADLIEQQNNQRKRPFRRSLAKQSSLDDSMGEIDINPDEDERPTTDSDDPPDLPQPSSPRPGTPPPIPPKINKGLPWMPKVRQKDIDAFMDSTRVKFVGYPLQGDRISMAGLPQPIHEGVDVLTKHIYTSLADVQMKAETDIKNNPRFRHDYSTPQVPVEIIYGNMYFNLPQIMIALLKILLAAAPTSKSKSDSINIMADCLPEEMPTTVVCSLKLALDVNRHKEILVKAVSATILLLLKHFKINHIYQFEFMSQHLVFANCIPLILKIFNHNIMGHVQSKNGIALLDFPACVIGDPPEMTAEALEACTGASLSGMGGGGSTSGGESPTNSSIGETTTSFCCWRNMFSCINLLRILNKLCKWKHSRVMMLVVFKSAPILKRSLKVRHAMMQLYILKLLKMQTKYLGRQWRKTNMKTLSAIYQKVRHRLNDDWAYGNDPDARPWDFQNDECALRNAVDFFNTRRYKPQDLPQPLPHAEFDPVDNDLHSVMGRPCILTDDFKRHYDLWLQQEVISMTINWDLLLPSAVDTTD